MLIGRRPYIPRVFGAAKVLVHRNGDLTSPDVVEHATGRVTPLTLHAQACMQPDISNPWMPVI